MEALRNITRFTYEFTSFQGWRLTICRLHTHFTRYFSDLQYGGEQEALQAALLERQRVYDYLKQFPDDPKKAFELCRRLIPKTSFPPGIRPRKKTGGTP